TLRLGTSISIGIISDFLKKLLSLPFIYFETKISGDFNQRIQDNERIEDFLTSLTLTTFFSMLTFLVFFGVLSYYNPIIMTMYVAITAISILWSDYWLKKRVNLDYIRVHQKSKNQQGIYKIINSVAALRLNNFEELK